MGNIYIFFFEGEKLENWKIVDTEYETKGGGGGGVYRDPGECGISISLPQLSLCNKSATVF